jgi:hypothetical protein
MLNKWDHSKVEDACYSDPDCESYKRAREFLGDSVEDWGCGTAWAKQYFANYRGIDGSYHKNVNEVVDLVHYTSSVDNILLRQVVEANHEWKQIIENAKKSFKKKLCLIIYTPFAEETTVNSLHTPVRADGSKMTGEEIPEIFFKRQDILDCFLVEEYKVREEEIATRQGYNRDWIIYVEKINS